jgi:hypothetical protein
MMLQRISILQVIQAAIALLVIVLAPPASCFIERHTEFLSTGHLRSSKVDIILRGKTDHAAEDSGDSWQEQHMIHGAAEIHEENDKEVLKSEFWAAFDAHDCDDSGMEAAVMERAVIMAAEMAHNRKEKAINNPPVEDTPSSKKEKWAEEHMIHGAAEIHEENDKEMRKSAFWAAFDAHDCDDPGMEAAMMERAVIMAAEMALARNPNSKKP